MDFKELGIDFFSSLFIVGRRFIFLIFSPYKTVRKISEDKDYLQIVIIYLLVFLYFKFAYFLRSDPYPATLIFLFFILNFFFTTTFFYFISKFTKKKIEFFSILLTFSYALLPTLIWFITNSILYLLIPPPRTFSVLGKAFSIFFITFSLSLLFWKIVLWYLSLRFSAKLGFYRIIYVMILYMVWFLPYSFLLYHFKIFRIPFI